MDFLDFDAESVFLGLLFGIAIGVAGCTAFIEWIRCENCCWSKKE